jgi:hypothetical protein
MPLRRHHEGQVILVLMWIEKIRSGVLAVQTDEDTLRYLRPSLAARIELLWMFRNFRLLPHKVLRPRQLTLVSRLLESGNFQKNGDCRIGTVEWLPQDENPVQKLPVSSAVQVAPSTRRVRPATAHQLPSTPRHRGKRRARKIRSG